MPNITSFSFRQTAAALLLTQALTTAAYTPSTPAAMNTQTPTRHTHLTINGDRFHINGEPTYAGRSWRGHSLEGLLLNSRMVQGIFDDLNPATRSRWAYPDTGEWDPERNTREFIAAMPEWRAHGLLAFTLNLQGGSPEGYSRDQPWHNSAFDEKGALRPDYMDRAGRILDRADELGMVVILGYFYFGQDQRLEDEAAVLAAVDNATRWLLERGYRHVLVEINNECDVGAYDHAILKPDRVPELITRVQEMEQDGYRLLVSTSFKGGAVPAAGVIEVADFILIHGNGVQPPARMTDLIRRTRERMGDRRIPLINNEDDHYDFDQAENNFHHAVQEHVSWGYFDFRRKGEGFAEGYQSVPVDWGINSRRKRQFFDRVREMSGMEEASAPLPDSGAGSQ